METAVQKFLGKDERLFESADFVIKQVPVICSENTEKILSIFGGPLPLRVGLL